MDKSGSIGSIVRGRQPTAPPTRRRNAAAIPTRLDWLLAWGTLLLAGAVILAHAVLILGGRWDGDEFVNFAHYRQNGLAFLWFRMLAWSPRPISELVLYIYSLVVQLANAPLTVPFLALLWAILFGSAIAVNWRRNFTRFPFRLNLSLSLSAMFLLGHPISEMFFWPMEATPYLLTLAALVVATFLILNGSTNRRRGRLICGIAVSAAVLNSEAGEFFAVGFAVAMCMAEWGAIRSGGLRHLRRACWYLVPLILSAATLACDLRFRISEAADIGASDFYFHHFWFSLLATLLTLPSEPVWGELAITSLVLKGLLFLGFFCIWSWLPSAYPPRGHLTALATGTICAMVLTVFASFYEYGAWGFERHRTFFQCLLMLLLLIGARGLAATRPMPTQIAGGLGPFSLAAAMLIGLAGRAPDLVRDYALLPEISDAQSQTWESGMQPRSDMQFVLSPHGRVLEGTLWQTGHFSLRPGAEKNTPWYVAGVLNFFDKQEVDIIQGGDGQ